MKSVVDLNREELRELKERYLLELAESGQYSEILGVEWDYPSAGELAAADKIVPDDVIFNQYAGVDFVEEDFFCNAAAWWDME